VKVPELVFEQLELDLELRDGVAVEDATGDGTFRQFKPVAFEVHAGTEAASRIPRRAIRSTWLFRPATRWRAPRAQSIAR
jgi:hypothetical protein